MIALRQLTDRDWEAFRAIRLRALAAAPGVYFATAAESEAWTERNWRDLLSGREQVIFGAFDGEQLVGITGVFTDRAVDPTGGTALFGMTWLDPDYRGRGTIHQYHAARLRWARERGFRRATVGHRASNLTSRRAILAAGFQHIGAQPHRWPDGMIEDDVLYGQDLA